MMIMVLVTPMMVMVLVANMWLGRMVKEEEKGEDGVDGNHVAREDPVQGFRLRVRVDWPLSRATAL